MSRVNEPYTLPFAAVNFARHFSPLEEGFTSSLAIPDLGLQGAGGVISRHDGDFRSHGLVGLDDLIQGLLHGGRGKDVQLYRFGGGLCGVVCGGAVGVRTAAAGGQGQRHGQGQNEGEKLFHGEIFLS